MFSLYPVDYVNNPFVISQNDNMVAINSALEIDLLGQVAAESIGPKQFSGIGGVADLFCRTNEERAAALIGIAHPNFRDQLRDEYEALFGVKLPRL